MDDLTYHEHPTKEDLLEYFGQRIAIRKMTSKEAFRLMSVSDEDIEKIQAYPFKTYAERKAAIAKADKKGVGADKARKHMQNSSVPSCRQFYRNGLSILDILQNVHRHIWPTTICSTKPI